MALQILATAPALTTEGQFYWTCYHDLGSCRPQGMGFGSIPFTAITEYARFYGFNQSEAERLVKIIQATDNKHVRLVRDKQDKEAGKAG